MRLSTNTGPLVGIPGFEYKPWSPFLVKGEVWRKATADLLKASPDGYGRRELAVKHPESSANNPCIAPGIQARFGVIPSGQSTRPHRSNESHFVMIIRGSAEVTIDGQTQTVGTRDFFNVPGMRVWSMQAAGGVDLVYLNYSNRPVLENLGVFLEFPGRHSVPQKTEAPSEHVPSARIRAGNGYTIDESGGHLLPYEHLVDPQFDKSSPKFWRWENIKKYLPNVASLDNNYDGRPLWILYNSDTKNRAGTTSCFFATIFSSVGGRVTPSHKHASAAVNFIIDGSGHSFVGGTRVDWAAGDIMLSAPGWLEHSHCVDEDNTNILTIQDHPLHISMESLVWQERLPDGPLINVGSDNGYVTNLDHSL